MSRKSEIIKRMLRLGAADAASIESVLEKTIDGGPGSGNFGHAGRPGKVGGSSKGEGGGGKAYYTPQKEKVEFYHPERENVTGVSIRKPDNTKVNFAGRKPFKEINGGAAEKTGPIDFVEAPEPDNLGVPKITQMVNKQRLKRENMEMADKCFADAKEFPEGSAERNILSNYADVLSKPLLGRPTPEQSKEMTKKFLGNISSQLKPYAQERYKRDLADEPNITNDLCDISEALGTSMYGLGYRLKKASDSSDGSNRIAQKIQENIDDARKDGKNITYEEAVDQLSDMVRYTQACSQKNLVSNFERTRDILEKKGYKVAKIKNTWNTFTPEKPYRGLNCVFISPNGTRFELQFHTPESLVAKELQHPWYEEVRNKDNPPSPERKAELEHRMYMNMKTLTAPEGIERIESYPPKNSG